MPLCDVYTLTFAFLILLNQTTVVFCMNIFQVLDIRIHANTNTKVFPLPSREYNDYKE